ncbi:MAG: tRNA-dihydrouridine synthase family protein [Phycisphaeraceae bacterium]|nr:tRNA-dihydrouridine synthase family protein [Phycisphaeraceae bacterium]
MNGLPPKTPQDSVVCEGAEESLASCDVGGNATGPSPAIAPGIEEIDARAAAAEIGASHGGTGIDPRIPQLVPGFDAPFFQAGLAGYSDAAMRIIARRHGCPFCVTEALLDRTLLAGGRGFAKADLGEIADNVPGGEEDHPLAGQIMGSDPREMAAAAIKMIEQGQRSDRAYREMAYEDGRFPDPARHQQMPDAVRGDHADSAVSALSLHHTAPSSLSFEVIDVNLACPVKKIKSKARGGHWLAEPEGAIRILEAVREAVPPEIPCAVKLRRAFDDTPEMAENFERIFAAAYDIGYAWATVHARTVEQRYVGPSRWTFFRDLRARHSDKVFFGSGDVWRAEDIFLMMKYGGVSGVSVARGCIGNPWIFAQARALMRGEPARPPTIAEQRAVLDDHFKLLVAVNGTMRPGLPKSSADGTPTWSERHAARLMRKFGVRFSTHHPERERVKEKVVRVATLEDWRRVLSEHYGEPAAR